MVLGLSLRRAYARLLCELGFVREGFDEMVVLVV